MELQLQHCDGLNYWWSKIEYPADIVGLQAMKDWLISKKYVGLYQILVAYEEDVLGCEFRIDAEVVYTAVDTERTVNGEKI